MPGDLSIAFSPHAMIKLAQRGLTREMVIRTLEKPLRLVSVGDRIHAFRKFRSRHLKVIFVRTEYNIVIITQYFIKKLP